MGVIGGLPLAVQFSHLPTVGGRADDQSAVPFIWPTVAPERQSTTPASWVGPLADFPPPVGTGKGCSHCERETWRHDTDVPTQDDQDSRDAPSLK
jgi:hypothetical protein